MNEYDEMRKRHIEEINKFPIAFAFSDEQFEKNMKKLGLTANDTDKIIDIGFGGGFIRKTDVEAFNEMNIRHRMEEKQAIENDKTGEGYIKDMFESELASHEYGYTFELEDTLDALGLSIEEINANENLKHGLDLALNKYRENEEEEELEE